LTAFHEFRCERYVIGGHSKVVFFFLIFCSQQCQDDNVQTSDVGETLIPSKTNVLSVVLELYVGLILILDKTTEINDIKTLLPLRSESEVVVVRP